MKGQLMAMRAMYRVLAKVVQTEQQRLLCDGMVNLLTIVIDALPDPPVSEDDDISKCVRMDADELLRVLNDDTQY